MQPTESVKRIDRLTPAQEARMREWAAKWIGIGLQTGPADREAFELYASQCMVLSGFQAPKRIIWVDSPFALAIRAPTLTFMLGLNRRVGAQVEAQVRVQVEAQVRNQVRAQVRAQVEDQVGTQVEDQVGAQVRALVRDQIEAQVGVQVRDQIEALVRAQVEAQVRDQVRDQVVMNGLYSAIRSSWHHYIGGQFWAGWGWSYWGSPSLVSFFREACGLDLGDNMNARADAYTGAAKAACWWWPHQDFVMVCERPVHIDRDRNGRLHSTGRKAIAWPDGWGLYMIHGVRVPDFVVTHPEQITVAIIDAEENDEIRRSMVDVYGSERFVRDSGAKKIQQDEYGTLYERRFKSGAPAIFIHLINSTPEADGSRREFWRRVHPELRPLPDPGDPRARLGEPQKLTARNAVASTYGMRGEDYSPQIQT